MGNFFLKQIIVGPSYGTSPAAPAASAPGYLPRQGYRNGQKLLKDEWGGSTCGIVRVVRLSVLSLLFASLTPAMDALTWRLINIFAPASQLIDKENEKIKGWVVSCSRELLYSTRTVFFLLVLFTPMINDEAVVILVSYATLDLLLNLAGGAFVWGSLSIQPERSLLLALKSYGDIIVAFAVLYVRLDCLKWLPRSHYPSYSHACQALDFSLRTATTIGSDILSPNGAIGHELFAMQLAVFVIFVSIILSLLASRVGQ